MHPRIHILLSFAILACTFDATGLGGVATGPSGDVSGSTGAGTSTSTTTTGAPGTTGDSATSGAAGSGTGGLSTGGESEDPITTEPSQQCGDGVVDPGEACDDGPDNGPTGPCTPACAANVCGDGYPLSPGEACDDGNQIDDDACRNDCSLSPTCGNGKIDNGETCDDGNLIDSDGCIACKKATCGDGYIEANVESCDDGQESPTCNADCSVGKCGDTKLNKSAGEVCDLGAKNGTYNSGCNADCSGPGNVCGDGMISAPEERCDTMVPVANATCVNNCQAILCTQNFADCDNQPATGCEINTSNNDDHCGNCSTQCGLIEHCSGSKCTI
jgi:cysteine-rich repeat protein